MAEQAVFSCKDLTKTYGSFKALDKVSLKLERGRIYGLIGNNGAGKTTLMRIMMGLSFPTNGEISLFGQSEPGELIRSRSRIGCLIEETASIPQMSGKQNLKLLCKLRGIKDSRVIQDAITTFGLEERQQVAVKHYSLGMRQRLGLAGAILGNPELLVLDEPVNGLDPSGIREIRKTLLELNRQRNITMLISSHYLEQLHQLATDYIIIHRGRIIEQLTQDELEQRCSSYIVVETEEAAAAVAVLKAEWGEIKLQLVSSDTLFIEHDLGYDTKSISRILAKHQIPIQRIERMGKSLEEFFTALVGGERSA